MPSRETQPPSSPARPSVGNGEAEDRRRLEGSLRQSSSTTQGQSWKDCPATIDNEFARPGLTGPEGRHRGRALPDATALAGRTHEPVDDRTIRIRIVNRERAARDGVPGPDDELFLRVPDVRSMKRDWTWHRRAWDDLRRTGPVQLASGHRSPRTPRCRIGRRAYLIVSSHDILQPGRRLRQELRIAR